MLPIACLTGTAVDKEKATTSFIKSHEHIRDREGSELSCWSSGRDLDHFGGCSGPPGKGGYSRKQWQGIENEDTKGTVRSGKDAVCRKQEMEHAFTTEGYLLISRPADIKKSSQRGAGKAPKSWREDIGSKSEKEPDLQELCLDP